MSFPKWRLFFSAFKHKIDNTVENMLTFSFEGPKYWDGIIDIQNWFRCYELCLCLEYRDTSLLFNVFYRNKGLKI